MEACEDVVEHNMRRMNDMHRCISTAIQTIDTVSRFVAEAVFEHHDTIMPHLSTEEMHEIQKYNFFR